MAYAKVYWLITVRRNRWGWYNTPATLDDHTPSAAEDWIYERVTAPFKKVNCRRIQSEFSNQLWCALPVKLMWWTSFPETGDLDGGTGQWFLFYEILGASWDMLPLLWDMWGFVRYVHLHLSLQLVASHLHGLGTACHEMTKNRCCSVWRTQ